MLDVRAANCGERDFHFYVVLNFSSDSCAKKSTKYKTDSVSSLSVTKFAEYIVVDYGRIRHYQQNTCQRLVLYHN